MGTIFVVGFGPGAYEQMTERARFAIEHSEIVIGYKTYIEIVRDLLTDKQIVQTGMTEEVARAQEAVRQAKQGHTVAVISSGESGIYGMAGLVYEVLIEQGWKPGDHPQIEVVPGVPALASCSSLLGAPLMHDFVSISLSDYLTPWEVIAKRVEAAGIGDFVVVLYNPKSGRRTRQIEETQKILLQYRSPDTPVGLVKSAFRKGQQVVVTTLKDMLNHEIGMLTTVFIGNSSTVNYHDLLVTPRGYQRKYTLSVEGGLSGGQDRRLQSSPWSLDSAVSGEGRSLAAIAPLPHDFAPILEIAVSPGVANKNFTSQQFAAMAELVGEQGTVTYTPRHEIILNIPNGDADRVAQRLLGEGLLVSPVHVKAQVVACDFCDGEKTESIPYAEEIYRLVHGLETANELTVGFNGCAMACYGAVMEDIGVVYRRGSFELYLGGKRGGRVPQPGQKVAEEIPPEQIVGIVRQIVEEYRTHAHPKERFHKFFKRRGQAAGYVWREPVAAAVPEAVCGD